MTLSSQQASNLPPLVLERPEDFPLAEALIDRAFGPGRYAKAAERLREGNRLLPELSFVARSGGELVGCARVWPVSVGGRPVVFLGPFAVADDWRSRGLGAALIERACAAAQAAGHEAMLLVGDEAYFGRLGFHAVGGITLPGPVDLKRTLLKRFRGEQPFVGMATPGWNTQ